MKTNFISRTVVVLEAILSLLRNPKYRLILLALVFTESGLGQINSYVYYSFENTSTPYTPHNPTGSELTSNCLSCSIPGSADYSPQSSNGILLNYLNIQPRVEINCGSYSVPEPQGSFSIEFFAKLDPNTGSNSSIYFFKVGASGGSNYSTYGRIVQYPEPMIEFSIRRWNITNVATEYKFGIPLNGIGRKSIGYYTDEKWHHYAFVYNNDLGSGDPGYSQMKVWVDGQCPNEFTDNRVPYLNKADYNAGTFSSNIYIGFGTAGPQNYFHGGMDEIAVFNSVLPDEQIFENNNNVKNHLHYQSALSTSPIPNPDPVYPTILDPLDFASGYDVSSFGDPKDSYHSAQVITMPETQLSNFPLPRYKPGVFMYPNYNWMSSKYMAGELQPGTTFSNKETRSGNIQLELASNWNYYFNLVENVASDYNGISNPNSYSGTWIGVAKLHPNLKFAATLYRIQLNIESVLGPNPIYGQTSMLKFQNFTTPSVQSGFIKNYFKNASGYVPPTNKVWCPAADTVEYNWDAKAVVKILNDLDVATGNLPISILGENNEYSKFYTAPDLNNDADAYSDRISKGLTETPYQSLRKQWIDQSYSKRIIDYRPNFNSISFLNYDVDGKNNDRWDYAYQRLTQKMVSDVSSPITENLPTPFFYPQTPENWRQEAGGGDIHGLNWIINSRNGELALNDFDFAPFIGAGWSKNESYNIRPAQWLGLLKLNCGLGARFFNVGFFNDDPSYSINAPANPKGYIWQATTPSYALGVFSHAMEFFPSNSTALLVQGNTALSPGTSTAPLGSLFTLGSPEKVAIVRKITASENYLISSTLQQFSIAGNSIPDLAEGNITLNSKTLKINIRKQGSVYKYDDSGTNPVFYQLDSWHENTHPEYWSKDFYFEAEVPDNTPSSI
jgi:Concanavalin A-like lectin/glucanases superfamily